MTTESEALRGLLSTMRGFVQEAVDKIFPASAITFETLRKENPELAKVIFNEAVIHPAKDALRDYPSVEAFRLLDDMEERIRQESITNLYYEIEVIVASRLLWGIFEREKPGLEKFGMGSARDDSGTLTGSGWYLADIIAQNVAEALARLAGVREHRVQLMLTAALVGRPAVEEASNRFAQYRRGSLLAAVAGWLNTSKLPQRKRDVLIEQLAARAPDEYIEKLEGKLAGTAFLGESAIQHIAHELLSGQEYLEF